MDRLLGEWGIPKDSPAGRQQLERALEARRGAEKGEEFQALRRGWCLGEETLRQELLAQMSVRLGGALRGGADAGGGSGGRAHPRGGTKAAAVAANRSPDPARGRPGEGGVGGALAGGDHDDGALDRGAPGDGGARTFEPPAVPAAQGRREYPLSRTDPFSFSTVSATC